MSLDIGELFNDELRMLNWLVDEFEIPEDVFRECGASYLGVSADSSFERVTASRDKDISGPVGMPKEIQEKARADFERLCQSAPHIPREAMEALGLAYSAFAFLTGNGKDIGDEKHGSHQSQIQALFAITMARGVAMGHAGIVAGEIQAMNNDVLRKKKLADAGTKGASVRLQPYAKFKSWVLKKGENLGASKAVARSLEKQLPEHLKDISKDPCRLIYDTLLKRNKRS